MTMSEPHPVTTATGPRETGAGVDADGTCAACPHPWHAHGALDVRFCNATVASSLIRGCICE